MSARLIIEVALRVLGVWYALLAVSMAMNTMAVLFNGGRFPGANSYWIWIAGDGLVRAAIGGVLVYTAPAIAARCYPPRDEDRGATIRVGAADLYHVACFLLGVYLLSEAVVPGVQAMVILFQHGHFVYDRQLPISIGTSLIYLTAGTAMVFGAERISRFFANLYYNPDTIPKQRFSIALLLIFMVLFAALLMLFRRLS